MIVDLTENEILAIKAGLDELLNSGDWIIHYEDESEIDNIYDGINKLKVKLYK
jgi:hypothetical protein